jgi:thiamine pyrophosphate-dependent acetolactate synthase large subunit-like protein
MNRRPAVIKRIFDEHPYAFVVLSNGLTSREAAHFYRQKRCLYLLHAMGEALAVGVGLAEALPQIEVVVIEGDFNALMGLAAWSLMPLPNLRYYVLDNRSSETTGGQRLPRLPIIPEWCTVVPMATGKSDTPNPPSPEEIWQDCRNWLDNNGASKGSAS